MSSSKMKKVTAGGLLVAMGVVYGDIGTSPLYLRQRLARLLDANAVNDDQVRLNRIKRG